MADISDEQQTEVIRLTNPEEDTIAEITLTTNELKTFDVADHGGVDTVLTIAAGAVVELKVGGSSLVDRKYIQIEALDKGLKWGFSNVTQSFNAFKSQFFILPMGAGTSVWLNNTTGASIDVAIAEIK